MERLPTYTPADLIAFEDDIKAEFLAGNIRAPVHLSGGNEEQVIEAFKAVRPTDWVLSTWRSHYHALLKGLDPARVRSQIMEGRSMYIQSAEHRFLTSSIVGGILPIGLGLAWAIRQRQIRAIPRWDGETWHETAPHDVVWCFVGDMTARTGVFHEAMAYATGHRLPLRVVVEDNGLSTKTPTDKVWGDPGGCSWEAHVRAYQYERTVPHVGAGEWVTFG